MNRPRITLNFAISADAKISTATQVPSGWTSDADSERYHRIRQSADAILVGRGTQEADQMRMTVPGKLPWRCVISRSGLFDHASKLFTTPGGPIHLIVSDPHSLFLPSQWEATIHSSLDEFLSHAARSGIETLLCEGGGQLVKELAERDIIDEIHLTWAIHTLIGGGSAPTLTGLPGDFLSSSRSFTLTTFQPLSRRGECFLTYTRKRA